MAQADFQDLSQAQGQVNEIPLIPPRPNRDRLNREAADEIAALEAELAGVQDPVLAQSIQREIDKLLIDVLCDWIDRLE